MQFKFLFLLPLVFLLSCQSQKSIQTNSVIIPQPNFQQINDGYFVLSSTTQLVADETFDSSVTFLKQFVEQGSAIRFRKSESNSKIIFQFDETLVTKEGYKLDISKNQITILAKTDAGAFYAVQSLRQLLPEGLENKSFEDNKIYLKALHIEDAPQFAYRGMHLDVGRHFFPVEFIKKYIDRLALLKMNTFHWHLTEDQGWRIEIKKYPKLQEIAAWRDETLLGHYNDMPHQFDSKRYGGFYTQEEVKDIVAYATARHITVIPEIEMPGHSQAAIAAYPHLGCTGENPGVAKLWGVFEDIYCPKEETFAFLEDVLDEVLKLFPSEYIHIGGDEAPKTQWKNCDSCQAIMKKEGLKDEHELQSYFITRMERYLNSKGRQIIGWDEILEGGLAPNATVMSWRGEEGGVAAAKQGHKVIMTPTSHCYFDYYQSDNDSEPLAIGGLLPLEKVYHFNPIPEGLTATEAQFVMGAQGNVWTEYMQNEKQMEYMAFPRAVALSEVLWTSEGNKNYSDFVKRLEHFHKRMGALDIHFANHLYEIKGELLRVKNGSFYQLQPGVSGKKVYFTTDGSEPTSESDKYNNPISINKNIHLKAAVFDENGDRLSAVFEETIKLHKAVGEKIHLSVAPSKVYSGSGAEGLINGIQGSDKRYGDKEWLGFWGDDLEIIIDLGIIQEVKSISTRFFDAPGQWIYAPAKVTIYLLDDYKKILHSEDVGLTDDGKNIKNAEVGFNGIKAKYLQLQIKNYGTILEGAQGAGNKAWLFVDEIFVE
ncbi:MAG: beta-N-acetylhexosaminidase [Flavobacteriaceae bacterium CG2_30_34_30]|nr:MAG: beta-N-acetylhexosaminidase [Flavobacteriaceae bacterium CG2_30_34_30]